MKKTIKAGCMVLTIIFFITVAAVQMSFAARITLSLCFLALMALWYVQHRQTAADIYELADALENSMEQMLRGDQDIVFDDTREELLSRLQVKLKQLYDVMTHYSIESKREREQIQSLVSDISHQTKTPAANIRMYAEIVKDRQLSDIDRRKFLERIQEQTKKLDFFIQSLLKMSRLEAGILNIEKKSAPLWETLGMALASVRPKAEEKEIAIQVDCPVDIRIEHDVKWTEEAIFNILDNAVKYTGRTGQIQIKVVMQEIFVKISIRDNVRGIEEEEQGRIFQRFFRGRDVHDEEGAGLGLYLAREIVTRQGGYIEVHSQKGEGSQFRVYLPAG